MKFTNLNTKTAQDEGAFCHLRHPVYQFDIYTGEFANENGQLIDETKAKEATKVGVMVRGYESPKVSKVIRKHEQKAARTGKPVDQEAMGIELAAILIIRFEGLTDDDGVPLEATHENKISFLEQSNDIVIQIVNFAKTTANFFAPEPTI